MSTITSTHPSLGPIKCLHDPSTNLTRILGIPYATIPQRFARSKICLHPSVHPSSSTRSTNGVFDATVPGPSSIQPFEQSENCLTLSIHLPPQALNPDKIAFNPSAELPVLVFIHGGAYFLGSGTRPYYSPTNLLVHAIQRGKPVIFVSITYRLGALGFLHAETAEGLVPPNNGLHDQLRALEWIQQFIAGFGGDPDNVTAIGQSAGGESLAVLSNSEEVRERGLFKRCIILSGSIVTMPALTRAEHRRNFREQAEKAGIQITKRDGEQRDIEDTVYEMIAIDVGKIRELAWVGLPCTQTDLFPFEKPSMGMLRRGGPEEWRGRGGGGIDRIIGTTTYDGGISFNMMSRDANRTGHAKAFVDIATDVLGKNLGSELCELYDIENGQDDADALQRICLFESDIGFFFAALATGQATVNVKDTRTYFQIFDLPNPFDGPLRQQGEFATHTFDITTTLGGVQDHFLPKGYGPVIASWRDKMLDFVVDGTAPCKPWDELEGRGLVIDKDGVREVEKEAYIHSDGERRRQLMELADRLDREEGWDVLWVDICRRFLMKGK
ncbi:alpha/beta-hydrolase [Setomelanomma holmii]|uniref:Alpha/beta-hydrolase n=1 Tax=Setomelanomma holmii TaxID=210430 RepID=A0A9P4HEE9_9PLEO|nr:alpha/beta-hydrolase [Setomelanomma holmii]